MTSITISSGIQPSPAGLASATKVVRPTEAAGSFLSRSNSAVSRESHPEAVDTVTLQTEATQQADKNAAAVRAPIPGNQTRAMSDILFSYNYKGDLRIKFMDSVNELVYQTPPEYVSRLSDLMSRPQTSVTTKA